MYIGIDVGGTNLVAGLVDQEGTILHKSACPVNRSWSAEELVSQLAQLSVRAAQEGGVSLEKVEGAGAGIPGLVDNEAGIVVKTPNMPFRDTPFRELFQRELNIPVHLGNDADCAAAGEYWAGARQGLRPRWSWSPWAPALGPDWCGAESSIPAWAARAWRQAI